MAKSPLGRPLAAKGFILHTYFSEPLKTWILQYLTAFLKVLGIPKALILGPLFDHFFDTILGPPLEEPFGPPWPPTVPTLPPHVDFGLFVGPPLGSKMGARAAKGLPKTVHKRGPGNDPCPQGVPRAILIDFGDHLGGQSALLAPPWVTQGAFLGPLG